MEKFILDTIVIIRKREEKLARGRGGWVGEGPLGY